MMITGLISDPAFLDHDPGSGHPECRQRLEASISYLEQQPWFAALHKLTPRKADQSWIEQIHAPAYIQRARDSCLQGAAILDSMDVGICNKSFEVALLAAGAPLVLADEIINQRINNGFALIRPPGHHAEYDRALGFCLFNNVAILARYLQQQHRVDKILILDWDVHHGNGTQHSFEEDPSVFYISTHQYPFYPGTGAYWETGIGRGAGTTLNCPMPANSGDQDYERVFMERIIPAIQSFQPEFVIISAGFDAHAADPLAQICLSTEFFGWMTEQLMALADQYSEGRIISVLEGGYDLNALPRCIETHLAGLSCQ